MLGGVKDAGDSGIIHFSRVQTNTEDSGVSSECVQSPPNSGRMSRGGIIYCYASPIQ